MERSLHDLIVALLAQLMFKHCLFTSVAMDTHLLLRNRFRVKGTPTRRDDGAHAMPTVF